MSTGDVSDLLHVGYVGVVEQINDKFRVAKLPLVQPLDVIQKFREIRDDSKKNVLDLQKAILAYWEKKPIEYWSLPYCFPYAYSANHIPPANPPEIISEQCYHDQLKEESNRLDRIYYSQCVIDLKLEEWKHKCKVDYFFNAVRAIYANTYFKTRLLMLENPAVKFFSTDRIGWPSYHKRSIDFEVTDDVNISVYSNFGYGNSSYFYILLTYKGILVLPYSFIVEYYYSEVDEIISYTRKYYPDRENWNDVLNFVSDACNTAASDVKKFIRKYIVEEVEKMLYGLADIIRQPAKALADIVASSNLSSRKFTSIRNIDARSHRGTKDTELYEVLPSELPWVWQSKKINDAVCCIDKLLALKAIYPEVEGQVSKIRHLATEALPGLLRCKAGIDKDIGRLHKEVAVLKKSIEILEFAIKPFEFEIEWLEITAELEHIGEIDEFGDFDVSLDWRGHSAIQKGYEVKHSAFTDLKLEKAKKINEKVCLERNIFLRETLSLSLERCIGNISKSIGIKQANTV